MAAIRFRVRHGSGEPQELFTETPGVRIGSGSHCEIRLPMGTARVEHVFIEHTPTGLRALARSVDPVPKLDGVEFTEAPIRGEVTITIGSTRIEVIPAEGTSPSEAGAVPAGRRNPRIYVYLALGVACFLALVAARPRAKVPTPEPREVPALWDARERASCPEAAAEEARAIGNTRFDLAVAKQERSPFHPEDGVAAVSYFESAAACFRTADRGADADFAQTRADRLRGDMVDRFRNHRLRLARALATEQWSLAEHESGVLLSFLPPTPSDYSTWLSNLRRRLSLQYGSKGKKES
jgi:hypothetical protein